MKQFLLIALLATSTLLAAPGSAKQNRDQPRSEHRSDKRDSNRGDNHRHEGRRDSHSDNGSHLGQKKRAAWQDFYRYDHNRYDPRYGNYRANRYYRNGAYYQDRLTCSPEM